MVHARRARNASLGKVTALQLATCLHGVSRSLQLKGEREGDVMQEALKAS